MERPQATQDYRRENLQERRPSDDRHNANLCGSCSEWLQRIYRRIRLVPGPRCLVRKSLLRCLGAHIGRGTNLPACHMPWPHQVWLGEDCRLESGIYFKFDWFWRTGPSIVIGDRVFIGRNVEFNIQGRIVIGNNCLIASGCVFVDHNHGVQLTKTMADQPSEIGQIILGQDVWIGTNSVILKNVRIGDGAIVGAGSVVTKPVPAKEIWAGNPARKIRDRA